MNKNYKRNNDFPGLVQSLLFYFIISVGLSLFPLLTKAAHPDGTPLRGERPPIDVLSVPDEALENGIIRIKFSRSQESFLDQSAPFFGPGRIVQFGIPSIDQLNMQFGVTAVQKTFDAALQNTKFTARHREWGFHLWYDLIVPQGVDVRTMVMAYRAYDEIDFSEPVYKKQMIGSETNLIGSHSIPSGGSALNFTPVDPRFNEQWHYHNTGQEGGTPDADIDLPEAWDITKGDSNVVVAIIDGGIDYTHPDLAANIWPGIGYNFMNNSSVITPDNHGTHVAGTVAANTNNSTGVSGIAGGDGSGNGVRLMSCQVFTGNAGSGFQNATIYAADNGAAISQNSWGYTTPYNYEQAVLDAIDYFNANGGGMVMNGGITIYAAHNYNSSLPYYPAYYSNTMAVAATNNSDQKAYYSNYGSWVDISAPGGETTAAATMGVPGSSTAVLSTMTSGTYGFFQGTSMACPHVSGVAALVLSLVPGVLSPAELRDILINSTDNINALNPGYSGKLGSGRLNAYQALLLAQQYVIPTAAFSASSTLECSGSTITFTDQTLAPVNSWTWSFPGGSPSFFSGQTPPPIQYVNPGIYEVSLTVSDGSTTDTETKTAYVLIKSVIADFTANTTLINAGGSVEFTDLTDCSPDTWQWSFPGGTPSSYSGQTPPPIVYNLSGNYNVSLTASKAGASDTKTITSYIQVLNAVNMHTGSITTCNTLFYDSGGPNGNYQNYQDQVLTIYPASAGAAIRLDFTTFFLQNNFDVLFIYNGTSTSDPLIGSYTGQNGPTTVTSSHYTGALTVMFQSDCCGTNPGWAANVSCYYAAPVADFSTSNAAPSIGEVTSLLDLSSNVPSIWNWSISPNTFNFMNGTNQNSRIPNVQFTATGPYTVTLIVSNSSGNSIITKEDYINVTPAASCVPAYSTGSSAGDFISLVQLEVINNASGASPLPSYTDYSNLTANLIKGTSYTISLAGGTQGAANTVAVWIDFNQDNLFDPFEKLGNVALPASPGTTDITFSIPQQANNGISRMRVRTVQGVSDIDPCSLYSHGETEDYRVLISPVEYCQPSFDNGAMFGNYISLVQLEEINNVTGATPHPSYTFYDGVTANLSMGSEYTLTLSAGINNNNYMSAWIDFNNNSEFEENERLGFISSPESTETGTITFTVPEDAASGTTRMRVIEASLSEYYEYAPCDYFSYGEAEDYPVNISGSSKSLQINVFLEGLYSGSGIMNQANNNLGPEYGPGIADKVTVEFHNAVDYSVIEHSIPDVSLSVNGLINLPLPVSLSDSYYITIRHRNSIETTTAAPVSFSASSINYSFDTPVKAFGNNLFMTSDGNYAIYSGDISQDGIVDGSDMAAVDNASTIVLTGYVAEDTNGDGLVDGSDMALIDNNATIAITAILP